MEEDDSSFDFDAMISLWTSLGGEGNEEELEPDQIENALIRYPRATLDIMASELGLDPSEYEFKSDLAAAVAGAGGGNSGLQQEGQGGEDQKSEDKLSETGKEEVEGDEVVGDEVVGDEVEGDEVDEDEEDLVQASMDLGHWGVKLARRAVMERRVKLITVGILWLLVL